MFFKDLVGTRFRKDVYMNWHNLLCKYQQLYWIAHLGYKIYLRILLQFNRCKSGWNPSDLPPPHICLSVKSLIMHIHASPPQKKLFCKSHIDMNRPKYAIQFNVPCLWVTYRLLPPFRCKWNRFLPDTYLLCQDNYAWVCILYLYPYVKMVP